MNFHSFLIAGLLAGLQFMPSTQPADTEKGQKNISAADSLFKFCIYCSGDSGNAYLLTSGQALHSRSANTFCTHGPSANTTLLHLPHYLISAGLFPISLLLQLSEYILCTWITPAARDQPGFRSPSVKQHFSGLLRNKDTIADPSQVIFPRGSGETELFQKNKPNRIISWKSKQLLNSFWQSYLLTQANTDTITDTYSLCHAEDLLYNSSMWEKDTITDLYSLCDEEDLNNATSLYKKDTISISVTPTAPLPHLQPGYARPSLSMWEKEHPFIFSRRTQNNENQNRFLYFHTNRVSPHAKLLNSKVPVR